MKDLFVKSAAYGITKEQHERYTKFLKETPKEGIVYIPDIAEYLDWTDDVYREWFDEYCSYEEMFAHEILCGQNGADVTEEIRSAFANDIEEFDFYNY